MVARLTSFQTVLGDTLRKVREFVGTNVKRGKKHVSFNISNVLNLTKSAVETQQKTPKEGSLQGTYASIDMNKKQTPKWNFFWSAYDALDAHIPNIAASADWSVPPSKHLYNGKPLADTS